MNPETQIIPELLRLQDVCTMIGISRSTIYALLAENRFPAPICVTRRAIRWHRTEIEQWVRSRPAARPPRPTEGKKTAV